MNSQKEYITKYIIQSKEDLFKEDKINFYYFLFKYILKNVSYIYQFPFLLKTRKKIIEIFKSNELSYDFINNNIKEKFEYIIKSLDINYYYEKIPKDMMKIQEILKYYKEYLFISKKEDINILNDIIKNRKGNYNNYLKDYELAKKMNDRIAIIKYLFCENNKKYSENEINEFAKTWKSLEKMIIDKRIKKINKNKKTC